MFDLKEAVTWEELVELEPRLEGLRLDAQASRPENKRGFNYELAWARFKNPIANLVGWHRRDDCNPSLKTTDAYDVVYSKLFNTLHD